MRWRRAAIATCASVAVLAGAVAVVADAVAADHASQSLAGSAAPGGSDTGDGVSRAYRSSVTIVLDGPTEYCLSLPGADRAGERSAASCGAMVLPVGATEEDVLHRLGEPRTRRPLPRGGEAWEYSRYLDEQRYSVVSIELRFDQRRLVDSREYIFK